MVGVVTENHGDEWEPTARQAYTAAEFSILLAGGLKASGSQSASANLLRPAQLGAAIGTDARNTLAALKAIGPKTRAAWFKLVDKIRDDVVEFVGPRGAARPFGPRSVGAAQAPDPKALQTGGHTITSRTRKALGMTRGEAKHAMEGLKKDLGQGASHHQHKIMDNGDVLDSNTGDWLGNLFDYL